MFFNAFMCNGLRVLRSRIATGRVYSVLNGFRSFMDSAFASQQDLVVLDLLLDGACHVDGISNNVGIDTWKSAMRLYHRGYLVKRECGHAQN